MPGFTTHYLFGVEAYKRLKSGRIRRLLRDNHSAFALGLQGPDVFFYYLPSYLLHATNLGALAHEEDTGAFFANLLESRRLFAWSKRKQAIADAYIAGFIGHYSLDCTAHPYVYAFTSYDPDCRPKHTEYFGQHAYLETELDKNMLWICKHMRPTKFHQDSTIHLSPLEKRTISLMLTYAYHHTYQVFAAPQIMRGAMRWMETGTRLVNDPSGQKKAMVRSVEKRVLGKPFISAMLPSDRYRFVSDPLNLTHRIWTHPWTGVRSSETFLDLFERAGALYDSRLKAYFRMQKNGFAPAEVEAFLQEYGNRSFLSGEAFDGEEAEGKRRTDAVIFDLDGTLLDTLQDLCDAVNYALRENDMPERTLDEVRQFVGNGVEKLMIRAVPDGKQNPAFDAAFAAMREYYGAHCKDHTGPYPDILPLMRELDARGIKMAIVSNKLDSAVKELDKEYFEGLTRAAIGEMEGVSRKPAPDTAIKAMQELGVTADRTIYVGDSDVDIETAANAGIPCVSVTWGFRSEEFLREHGAAELIHQPMELLAHL